MQIIRNLADYWNHDWTVPLDSSSSALKIGMRFGIFYAILKELCLTLDLGQLGA